jgi:predicted ATPase
MARKRRITPGPYLHSLELVNDRVEDRGRYPYSLPAFRQLQTLEFHPKVTFLLGENGSGKSTLLEAIAVAWGLNPEGGSVNFNFATRSSHSPLGDSIRLARPPSAPGDSYFLRAESFFNVATEIERLDEGSGGLVSAYGGRSLHEQSHGESFFALFRNRFRDNGLYLMDEPEAALSPTRQIHFLGLLHDYVTHGCQFIIATHSPIILAYPEATIFELSDAGICPIAYTETEHYLVTRGFLSNPQRTFTELFREETGE